MNREYVDERNTCDPYEQFSKDNPEEAERVSRIVNEGRNLLEQGEIAEARVRFVKALSIFPYIPAALTNLAALSLHQEEFEQAEGYLNEVLSHYPHDPAAHAVAARYWLQRGSLPKARWHGRQGVHGLEMLIQRADELVDATLIDRARIILLSVLPNMEADDCLTRLYELTQEEDWDASAHAMFGIAAYNNGEFEVARAIWEGADDEEPVDLYLFLLDLIEEGAVVPFRLDYQLGARLPSLDELRFAVQTTGRSRRGALHIVTPQTEVSKSFEGGEHNAPDGEKDRNEEETALAEALRQAMVRELPTLAVLEGIHYIWYGTEEEAELAMSILFFERWVHFPELIASVVKHEHISYRVRLNAALYTLWTTGPQEAVYALEHIEKEAEQFSDVDELLRHIIWMQIALVTEDVARGQASEQKARHYAELVGDEVESWRAVLTELALRIERLAVKSGQAPVHDTDHTQQRSEQNNKVIPFPTSRREHHDEHRTPVEDNEDDT